MAIYQAKFLQPYNSTVNGAIVNTFQFTCQGTTITKYNIKIYKVSDNAQVYTTGDVTLSPVKYNNDIVQVIIPINTMTNGVQYKWTVTTFEGASSATSVQSVFLANAPATISMTIPATITSYKHTFNGVYSQANSVPLVYYYFILYDSLSNEIERTNLIFSGNVTYLFSGFISGKSYKIKVVGITGSNVSVESPLYSFAVSYSQASTVVIPKINQSFSTSLVDIEWSPLKQINGTITGGSSYIENYGVNNNWALLLNSGATWYPTSTISIGEDMSVLVGLKTNGFTTGKLIELTGATGSYEFGYNSSTSRFYAIIGGIQLNSDIMPMPMSDIIVLLNPTECYIKIENVIHGLMI